MIKVIFNDPDIPEWPEWCQDCDDATLALIRSVGDGNDPVITNLYKDDRVKNTVYKNIEGPFKGRCAYCEANVVDYQPGDIEHFRPKGRVRDKDNKIVKIDGPDGDAIKHPGYYWLAYNRNNLLLACEKCNKYYSYKNEKIGKGERFPVSGTRAFAPGEEGFEDPLLINPLVDDPIKHLEYDDSNGHLIPLSEKGSMTKDIMGLNYREQLVNDRIDAFEKTKEDLIRLYNENDIEGIKEKIGEIITAEKPFTLARCIIPPQVTAKSHLA